MWRQKYRILQLKKLHGGGNYMNINLVKNLDYMIIEEAL